MARQVSGRTVDSARGQTAATSTSAAGSLARRLQGVMIPTPTPFREHQVAASFLQDNLSRWSRFEGITGFVVLGSTGESPLLAENERDALIAASRDAIGPERALLVGVPAQATVLAIQQSERAAALGADGVLVLSPHYFSRAFADPAVQLMHYLTVADASPLPVIIYQFPQNTGITLDVDTVAALAEHDNVAGIKDSSGTLSLLAQMCALNCPAFSFMVGAAAGLLPSLSIGSAGGILALAAIAPYELTAIYRLARENDWEGAASVWRKLAPLDRIVHAQHGIGGLKVALDLLGYYGGAVRSPLKMPPEPARDAIARALGEAELRTAPSVRGKLGTRS